MLKSFQKLVSVKKTKLIKGLCLSITILFISLCITPFQIYAAEQTQIVPTWNWGSQYSSQFTVTNFCEGSGTSVSCELRFTANNSYYGYLSFDGYNGTTKWIDYKNVWIADGYGAYRYSLYQNGVIQINKINIEGGYLKSSMDNLDLQDIIDLLTAIETDTTSIDNQINTELQRLQSIINNQITQNGYLDILTKIRQFDFPVESSNIILYLLRNNNPIALNTYYYWKFPVFEIPNNGIIFETHFLQRNRKYYIILDVNKNIYNLSLLQSQITFSDQNFSFDSYEQLMTYYDGNATHQIIKASFSSPVQSGSSQVRIINSSGVSLQIVPYFCNFLENQTFTTDFALLFGFSNRLLDDLQIIAQGTTESNSAATGLDSETSSFESVASGLYTSENSFNQNMNSSLQSIDTSFNPSTSFGSKFLYSADWVRSQFNTITSNTPFGSVLSFSMLLGLSLLIIGKVFK